MGRPPGSILNIFSKLNFRTKKSKPEIAVNFLQFIYEVSVKYAHLKSPILIQTYQLQLLNKLGQGAFGTVHVATYNPEVSKIDSSKSNDKLDKNFDEPIIFRKFSKTRRKISENCSASENSISENFGSQDFGNQKRRSVAVKILTVTDDIKSFFREANTWAMCGHDHLVRLIGIAVNNEQPWLISEFISLGCLHEFLVKQEQLPLETVVFKGRHVLTWIYQIADAMEYLQGWHGTVHFKFCTVFCEIKNTVYRMYFTVFCFRSETFK